MGCLHIKPSEEGRRLPRFRILRIGEGNDGGELCHRINRFSGLSFHAFLSKTRIESAIGILKREGDLPLSSLARLAGYESYATFYRNFLKQVGMPPAEYLASLPKPPQERKTAE